ncbi:prenyltransferase [Alkalimarinus coralli]|uniref:prenyltransferase n=1 Tax=Alkalimarinus coralli TaxID=2935863 RepID=UPI00202B947A|nr:prenyltransferase [Alkalimarinus coralli]
MESSHIASLDENIKPKYRFHKALRPFSFPVALITCSLGVVAGWTMSLGTPETAALVLLAGLLLQAGVNLINDHTDLKNPVIKPHLSSADIRQINLNYRVGWLCFTFCSVIGLYLTYQTGIFLLILAIIGGFGALFYTTEPVHYKRRGLAVILVFFLMGVLMVYGAFYAVTGIHSVEVVILSIPVSFFTSALLLSNELRDYASDKNEGLKTLTVRLGLNTGRKLYAFLIALGFISVGIIISDQQLWIQSLALIPALVLSFFAIYIALVKADLNNLPPMTGRLYLVFGLGQIAVLLL